MDQLQNLGIDLFSILVYLINFGLIFYIVSKYITKPLIKNIDKRRDTIEENVNEADKLRKEIEKERIKLKEERENVSAKISEEISKIKKEAQQELNEQRVKMQSKQEKMLKETEKEINNRKKELVDTLKPELVQILNEAFNNIVSTKLPKEEIEKSVEEAAVNFKNDIRNS